MRSFLIATLLCAPVPSVADTVFARETLRAREIVTAQQIELKSGTVAGAATSPDAVIGLEVQRAIYAGRPVLLSNLATPAVVERNQIIPAIFSINGLTISTEARALQRGAAGDVIRAMNLTSRAQIRAEVQADGTLKVLP
ncbi:flagellar basal body P-ring formation chaperone FlgA [Marivita sp. S6314]|uniref:flagellar basal body P-ring formation chaperone FlgA n=1 Tax=Marivita sp. S6314 TaxID=2926406 RepID=UPI001FF2A442|nr:flagellar basal body P-ring formation chaperone FlgA [Marivita sp. S6314]MCK0151407.1 flagellar basal body P-ring formation chaperone FlgA [Marivita sp. S6314]